MKKRMVAIVGRPNVGKSTLFNRLIGRRNAIVDYSSGVTRDRNYGEVSWSGKEFNLIDTGGYVPDSLDLFESAIREQIDVAITEADVILFVVDVRTGIHPIDIEIAKILRESNKNFLLVVNKVDSENFESGSLEFYKLGVGKVYEISALGGRKVGDLLDDITVDFPNIDEDEKEDPRLKIAVVGRPNVGKSSLVNVLLGFERSIVTHIPGTTRDSLDSTLKYYGREIVLIDTAGLRKSKKVKENIEYFSNIRTLKAIGECDVTIIMLEAQSGLEKQDQKIIDEAVRRRKGIILAINKWDLFEKETNTAKKFEDEIKLKAGAVDYLPVMFISALTKKRIFKLIDLSIKIHEERKKKIPTNRLNDILLPEIEKITPPSSPSGKEIKIKYITQAGNHYPIFLFFVNYPKEIPENYKRFLEKLIRKNFGFEGVSITLSFKNK
ncbi:MAG TPA: ribosome biogenesis GTPase Der [Ignavibacteria bacterium]|nr:ribosome biogenesis GTPase Der [Ignavibacteria bacterium]